MHRARALLLPVVASIMTAAATPLASQFRHESTPKASIWYRGSPAGIPNQTDMATLRALGFSSITWPQAMASGAIEAQRLGATMGVSVIVRQVAVALTERGAFAPGEHVDVAVARMSATHLPALVWRAVAHGARVVSFDPGNATGTGLSDSATLPAWCDAARAIARQLEFNARLFSALEPPAGVKGVKIDAPVPAGLDLVLLQASESWVLIATNTAAVRVRATAHLPAIVPPALWSNLLDGAFMSMLAQPAGPQWTLDLEPGAARLYVINKVSKPPR